MKDVLYFDDFEIGQQFTTGGFKLDKEYAIGFARQYDPQYFHVDEHAAKDSLWGQLVASGWQTAAITMRLKTDTPLGKVSGGLIGLGIEAIKWPRPVYPEDTLRIVITIIEKRLSQSKPGHGIMKYKVETFNQQDEMVMEMTTAVIVPRS